MWGGDRGGSEPGGGQEARTTRRIPPNRLNGPFPLLKRGSVKAYIEDFQRASLSAYQKAVNDEGDVRRVPCVL